MPTVSRSINDITRLTPQANGNQIGGGNYRQNYITVDGAQFNNAFGIGTNLPGNGRRSPSMLSTRFLLTLPPTMCARAASSVHR
jgi:hypothetical protein